MRDAVTHHLYRQSGSTWDIAFTTKKDKAKTRKYTIKG